MGRAKGFIKSSGIYFVGNIMTKLLTFLLLPIYTALIAPDQFGLYNLSINLLGLLVPLFALEVWSGVLRNLLAESSNEEKPKIVLSGLCVCGIGIILFVVLLICAQLIYSSKFFYYIFFLGITQILHYTYLSFARGYLQNLLYAGTGIICTFITLSLNVLTIAVWGMGIEALFVSSMIGLWIQIIIIEVKLKIAINSSFKYFDINNLKELICFCLPLSFNTICYFFAGNYNSVVISTRLGLAENGYYSIAGKFVAVISLVSSCFSLASQEMIYQEKNNKIQLYNISANYYFKFISLAVLGAMPIIKILFPFLINDSYNYSLYLIPLYLLANIASSYSSFLGNYFIAEKKTWTLTISLLLGGIVNYIMINLLINKIGIQAANISLFCAFSVSSLIRLKSLKKNFNIFIDKSYICLFFCFFIFGMYIFVKKGMIINIIWCIFIGLFSLLSFKTLIINFFKKA